MKIKGIPIDDIITVTVPVLSAIMAWLAQRDRLPANVRRWLARIGIKRIESIIRACAELVTASPEQRRMRAILLIQDEAERRFGITIPDSVANLLLEYVYQRWKKRISR